MNPELDYLASKNRVEDLRREAAQYRKAESGRDGRRRGVVRRLLGR
ncbi:hypothetical protein [Bailinhaonella thermotolerans]|nr:hypothetical protein [Bailinhaonella thermotolerans]